MLRVCVLLGVIIIMTILALGENYSYFKKLQRDLFTPTAWSVDMVEEGLMTDPEEDELLSMERMVVFFMLCISSILVCWNFNHYRRKEEKEEYESKLHSIEKRFQQRLEILEDKFTDLKREFLYSCKNIELIYSREEKVLKEHAAILTCNASQQMDSEIPGIEQSCQTKRLITKDGSQQTSGITELDDKGNTPQGEYWNLEGSPGTGDPCLRNADSWYEESQKEEQDMSAIQELCNMDNIVEFVNDPPLLELEVTQSLELEDNVNKVTFNNQGITFDVCEIKSECALGLANVTDEKISPRGGEFEEVSSANNKNSFRRIPQYQGLKKSNSKQPYNSPRLVNEENLPPFVFPKASDRSDPGRLSRPSTPRQYTPPEGVEINQGFPNRRRKPRNYNAK